MTVELKACPNPWCEAAERDGDYSPAVRLHHFGNYRVVCTSCMTEGPLRSTKDEAIAAWNERTAPAVPQDVAGMICALIDEWSASSAGQVPYSNREVCERLKSKICISSQQPSRVAVGELKRFNWTLSDGSTPDLVCDWCQNRVPILEHGICSECREPGTAAPAVPQDMAGLIAELQEPWTQTQSRRVDVERRAADMLAALSQQPSPVAVGEDERPPILGAFVNHARDVLQRHSTPSEGEDDVALALMIELAKIAGDRPAAFTLENGGPIGTIMKQQHAAIRAALARAGQGYGRGVRDAAAVAKQCEQDWNLHAHEKRQFGKDDSFMAASASAARKITDAILALAAPLQNGEG